MLTLEQTARLIGNNQNFANPSTFYRRTKAAMLNYANSIINNRNFPFNIDRWARAAVANLDGAMGPLLPLVVADAAVQNSNFVEETTDSDITDQALAYVIQTVVPVVA
jgi:hypothetical protein